MTDNVNEYKYWHLRNHKLFAVLNNSQIKDLCVILRYKVAFKSEVIHFSDNQRIYFLKKGIIKIVEIDEEGNENITDIIKKGDIFGQLGGGGLEMDSDKTEQAIVISKEVDICSFKMNDFEDLLERYPSIGLQFSKLIGFKLKRLKRRYSDLIFKDVKERILIFLKEWAEKEGVTEGKSVVLENYLTQEDIAKLVCSTRQTTTSILKELEKEGQLEYSRKQIILHKV